MFQFGMAGLRLVQDLIISTVSFSLAESYELVKEKIPFFGINVIVVWWSALSASVPVLASLKVEPQVAAAKAWREGKLPCHSG